MINFISFENTINNNSLLQDMIRYFNKIGFENEIAIEPLETNTYGINSFSIINYIKTFSNQNLCVPLSIKNDYCILLNKKLWNIFLTTNQIRI